MEICCQRSSGTAFLYWSFAEWDEVRELRGCERQSYSMSRGEPTNGNERRYILKGDPARCILYFGRSGFLPLGLARTSTYSLVVCPSARRPGYHASQDPWAKLHGLCLITQAMRL